MADTNNPHDPKKSATFKLGAYLAALLLCLTLVLWFVGAIGGNVREVDPGRLYRSAQLSGATLERTIRSYKIASIVNLRGKDPGDPSYDSEMSLSKEFSLRHCDISLSAYHLPPPAELAKLLNAFDSMPRPILVHCRGGSDRTGLASTIYENLYEKIPLDQAESSQLTWRYGHLAFTKARAMNQFFDLYRNNSEGLDLRTWIAKVYPALYKKNRISTIGLNGLRLTAES
jgi:protein tyrosine phosphatase (PTP) superfamily phosphohydrolase (DUF442 family)